MIFHSTRCSARASRFNTHLLPRFFTSTAGRARPAIKATPKIVTPSTLARTPAERSRSDRMQLLAAQLIKAGRDEIYKNTAANGYVATSLIISVLSYACIGYLYNTKLWNVDVAKARGLDWKIPKAYQITMIAWGCLAAYAFTRTFGVVNSIRLINQDGRYQLQTSIRRPIPFLRPERYISEPHELAISHGRLTSATQYENMIVASEGNSIMSKVTRALFYTPFHNTRKAMGGVGLVPMQVGPTGSQRHLLLDTDGLFSNSGKDLIDLSKDEI